MPVMAGCRPVPERPLKGSTLPGGYHHVGAELLQQRILVQRDHGIEAVVAAEKLHDHQHAVFREFRSEWRHQRIAEAAHGNAAHGGHGGGA
jgi:hypothetical protein